MGFNESSFFAFNLRLNELATRLNAFDMHFSALKTLRSLKRRFFLSGNIILTYTIKLKINRSCYNPWLMSRDIFESTYFFQLIVIKNEFILKKKF
jgi:hypothetical protein